LLQQPQQTIILLRLLYYCRNTRMEVWIEENPCRIVVTIVVVVTMMVPAVKVMYGVLPVVIMVLYVPFVSMIWK
jgi:hypothetical protein